MYVVVSSIPFPASTLLLAPSINQRSKDQDLMDRCGDAAEAGLARVVKPAQTQVVHPPDLGSGCYCDVYSDGIEVPEGII